MFFAIGQYLAPLGLQNPTLDCLVRNAQPYSSLLFQPADNIELGANFIRIADIPLACSKFRDFFRLASELNVELAVSPEYSCPWQSLHELIDQDHLPQEGKLWILGTESIRASEFRAFTQTNNQVTWVFEDGPVNQNQNNQDRFLNPLCYLFKTRNNEGQIRNVAIVQFKTHPMGGQDGLFEQNGMINGNRIYVIDNSQHSIKLLSLNCSDVANHLVNLNNAPTFLDSPYLIFHIQLNKVPHNLDFGAYRIDTFRRSLTSKEFVILNWANNTSINAVPVPSLGGSAIYLKTKRLAHEDETNITDERLTANHNLGLYYTRWQIRYTNSFYLNYGEGLYLYRNIKMDQVLDLPAHQVRRTGPEMLNYYNWIPNDSAWQLAAPDDGFVDACAAVHGGNFAYLIEQHNTNPIDAERLITISVGQATTSGWYHPFENTFFKVCDDEICNRMTFTQYPNADSTQLRQSYLRKFHRLQTIITDPDKIPSLISDLRNNCHIRFREEPFSQNFNLNIYPLNDVASPATGAYLGEVERDVAQSLLNDMIGFFEKNQFGKRVVVWYRNGDDIIVPEFLPDKPKITDKTNTSKKSYRKTKV